MTHSRRDVNLLMLSNPTNAARHADKIMKVIIVSRVAGGTSCAARLRRLHRKGRSHPFWTPVIGSGNGDGSGIRALRSSLSRNGPTRDTRRG